MSVIKIKLSILIFISLLLIVPLAFAEETTDGEITLDKLLNSKEEINAYLQENEILIPSGVDFIVKDGNILINISMDNGFQEIFYIIIEEKRICSVEEGIPEKMNYEIKTDEETITEIIQSETTKEKIVEFYDSKRIVLKAYGFGNKIRLFFGKIFFKIFV